MNVKLPNDVSEFVNHLVASGRYQSEHEAVAEGLRLLMNREQLRADIDKGFRQIEAGKAVEGDEAFKEVNQMIDAIEKEQLGT